MDKNYKENKKRKNKNEELEDCACCDCASQNLDEEVKEFEEVEVSENCEECANEKMSYYEELENKTKEYIKMAQQIQADFDNFRKKTAMQIEKAKQDGIIETIQKIIPVLDSFAGAKKMITDEKLLEGFLLVENQMMSALKGMGVEEISATGEEFNPNYHNALAVVCDENLENNIIKEEYQKGYKIKEKIIRYSQVVVNKRED